MNAKSEQTFEPTSVTSHLDAETNHLLTEASKITGRSKKTEAEFRVVDHIRRFEHYLTPEVLKEREPGRGEVTISAENNPQHHYFSAIRGAATAR